MKRKLYYLVPGIIAVFIFILSGCSSTPESTRHGEIQGDDAFHGIGPQERKCSGYSDI